MPRSRDHEIRIFLPVIDECWRLGIFLSVRARRPGDKWGRWLLIDRADKEELFLWDRELKRAFFPDGREEPFPDWKAAKQLAADMVLVKRLKRESEGRAAP